MALLVGECVEGVNSTTSKELSTTEHANLSTTEDTEDTEERPFVLFILCVLRVFRGGEFVCTPWWRATEYTAPWSLQSCSRPAPRREWANRNFSWTSAARPS